MIKIITAFLFAIGVVSLISFIIYCFVSNSGDKWFERLVLSVISFGLYAIILQLYQIEDKLKNK